MSELHPRPNLPQIARRLAEHPDLWLPQVRYDEQARYYTRLASQPAYEAWLLTWLPGQATAWHDHGGSAGAFTVVQGSLTEQHAIPQADGTARIVPRERRLGVGSLRPFGRQHLHRVSNHDLLPAVSIHVYAPSLREMNEYEAHGSLLSLFRSNLAGVNW